MEEEKANKTESQPQCAPVDSAPAPPSPVIEKESKKEDLPNGVGQELSVIPVHKEKATSVVIVNEKESKKEDPPNGVGQELSVVPAHKEKATSAVQRKSCSLFSFLVSTSPTVSQSSQNLLCNWSIGPESAL